MKYGVNRMNKYSHSKQLKQSNGNTNLRKEKFIRKVGRFFLKLFTGMLIIGTALYLSWFAWLKINNTQYFSIKHLECSPTKKMDQNRILNILKHSKGMSIFRADVDKLAGMIEDFRWVKEAVVYRILPDTLEIDIQERIPSAVAIVGNKKYLVGKDGVIIKSIDGNPFDVPFIYPSVERKNTGVKELMDALNLLKKNVPGFYNHIERIKPGDRLLRAHLDDRSEVVYLNPEDPIVNIRNYQSIERILHRKYAMIEYIDLRWEKQIYVQGERLNHG